MLASPAAAGLNGAVINTEEPLADTPFLVTVNGSLHDSCWSLVNHWVDVGNGIVHFNVSTLIEGFGCLAYVTEYEVESLVTIPEPGEWTLRVVEIHVVRGDRLPIPDDVMDYPLTIGDVVDSKNGTWSAIKALYR